MDPDPQRGISVLSGRDGWIRRTYRDLAADVTQVTTALQEKGVDERSVVAICQPDVERFVPELFGVLAAGATVAPLASASMFRDRSDYGDHLRGVLEAAQPTLMITADDDPACEDRSLPVEVVASSQLQGANEGAAAVRPINPIPLLQFTSGSSGRARGVSISNDALGANLRGIRNWLGLTPDTRGVSWLPTHHDMGLVGCLISAVTHGCDLDLMSPAQFIRTPLRFLESFNNGAEYTAMPNFGLDYVVRRVSPESVAHMSLGHVRAIIVGAERVSINSVDRFLELLGPAGLRPESICPAYGLAEATLAVTGKRLGTPTLVDEPGPATKSPCVSCGPPLDGIEVTVVDENNESLPDGEPGEVVVEGESLFSGYVSIAGTDSRTRTDGRRLFTGDAGYLHDGQLYLIGRMGDSIKVRGISLFAEDLEQSLVTGGFTSGERLAVLLGTAEDGLDHVVVVTDDRSVVKRVDWRPILAGVAEIAKLKVLVVGRQDILRTSSGKPRRRVMWAQYRLGELTGKQDITELVVNPEHAQKGAAEQKEQTT